MNRTSSWLKGGIVAVLLLGPRSAQPAVKDVAIAASISREVTHHVEEAFAAEVDPRRELQAEVDALAPPMDPFPGRTYGNLDGRGCLWELHQREISFERYGHARGVETPVRLTGALHGVFFRADGIDWETSARREVLDCRLVLALDDLAALLAPRGITEVVHYGIYRGDVPLPAHGRPRHHVAGLAIDVAAFVKKDNGRIEVRRDWSGAIGARTCGEGSGPRTVTGDSLELRSILCDLVDEHVFHQVLTPNHNASHRDHFHLEVMRQTTWSMVQ